MPEKDEEEFNLALHIQQVEDWEEVTDNATRLSERDRDYYDNIQLTAIELATLEDRGQPAIVFNVIRSKVNYLLGLEASTRTDPKGLPRNPQDEDAAEACTDGLRAVEDETELDQKFSNVWENMLVEGYGGIELTADEETGEIGAVEWPWDRLFYDPHSRKHDFSDARYLGGVLWMDAEEAKAKWPNAVEAIDATVSDDTTKTHADRPKWKIWCSGTKRKRVKIVQMYYLEGSDWHWCHFTKGGKLDGNQVSFRDDKGRSWCPLFLQSAYVDRNNNRYGEVRSMISPQDEVNKRRSKSLHLITQRQTKAERGAIDDVETMKKELAKPDGHIEINPGFEFEILDTSNQAQGNIELMAQAMQHMQTEGPNAALLGKQGGDPSGKAIQANQQGGQTELSRLMDRHSNLKKRTFQGIWWLIRQYKTAEWWVRVTDDEKNIKFVGFNRQVTMREKLQKRLEQQGNPPEAIQQLIGQLEADPMRGPMLEQVVGMENVPAEMNMDITIEQVPDVANLQEEQFKTLVALAPAVTFPPQIYIKASSLRDKQELLEELQKATENPEAAQEAQAVKEQAFRRGEAEIEKIKAETMSALAKADQADAQTGAIINPAIVEPGGGGQMPPPSPQQQISSPAPQPGF